MISPLQECSRDDRLSNPGYILLVDDDPLVLHVLNVHLKEFGEVFTATCGKGALLQVSRKTPDLILLDVDMPGMDGYATCRRLKENPETAELPVVFITSYDDVESETRAFDVGGADFIKKPVNPPVLKARVRTQLALKHRTDELRRLNNLDGLTLIANRRAFDEALAMEWRRSLRNQAPLSLLMLDIDHFKAFNDTYGHLKGDDCLRQVAQALHHGLKRAGDFVARYGGEEFTVILPNTGVEQAHILAQQLCDAVRNRAIPHAGSLTAEVVTVSIGHASLCQENTGECRVFSPMCPDHASPDALIEMADQALYQAKQQGRNRVCQE
jgi:diguanylate cyclase (GGDEF)-like protein